jgi:hypothetical protein
MKETILWYVTLYFGRHLLGIQRMWSFYCAGGLRINFTRLHSVKFKKTEFIMVTALIETNEFGIMILSFLLLLSLSPFLLLFLLKESITR